MARVLVADDDPRVLQVIAAWLEAMGHEVLVAADGGQAMSLLANHSVDVLITDLHMPVVDGFGLKSHLATLPRPIPAILISGAWTSAEKSQAATMGFARMYGKPADLKLLAADVDALARRP